MTKCDNCSSEFNSDTEGLVTTQKGRPVASVCPGCLDGARIVKLVLRKGEVGGFTYEQYAAIEMERPFPSAHAGKGLSTPIGQPKR